MKFKYPLLELELERNDARVLYTAIYKYMSKLCKYVRLSEERDNRGVKKIEYECSRKATHSVVWQNTKAEVVEVVTYAGHIYCEKHAVLVARKLDREQREYKEKFPNVVSPQLELVGKGKKKKVKK